VGVKVLAGPVSIYRGLTESLLLAVNPASLFLVAFIEAVFFPVPPDTILLPLVLFQPRLAIVYAGIATMGSVLGAIAGYVLGLFGGKSFLRRWVGENTYGRLQELFSRHQVWAVAVAGFTPIPYKVAAIGAGCFQLDFRLFVLVSAISRGARFALEAAFVALYGEPVLQFIQDYFEPITILVAVLCLVVYGLGRRRRKSR
jgi:membrane protein YqaA with SNARE-associated domain